MELARRFQWLALTLPVVLAAGATLARPAPPGALGAGRLPDRACPASVASEAGSPAGKPAWYRLESVLDAGGTLTGQRLTVGRGTTRWSDVLPPESFATGPVGGRVVVGDDDGQRSRLRLLDTVRGCWTALGTEADVVRSAVLAPDGTRVYEHRVERGTRRDMGVWQRELGARADGSVSVLAALAPDTAYGPTYTTSLLAAEDGRVVVSACGERVCRTRVLDPSTGAVARTDGTGPAAGLAGDRLVALAACDGLPCTLEAVDLASGSTTLLGEADGPAVALPDGSGLVVLVDDGGLGVARAGTGAGEGAIPGTAGLAPVGVASTSRSGIETPRGCVAVAPGGVVADPSAVRFLDPAALQFTAGEVLP